MAITDYASLKEAVVDWSHRDDIDTRVDAFIDLAESEMYGNGQEPLRLREGETRTELTASTASRYLALPSGYNEARRLRITDAPGNWDIRYMTPEQLPIASDSGRPRFFTVTDQIEFERTPDAAYTVELQYHADFTPLSSADTTNFVITRHPTIYLFGALWALFTWAEQDNEADRYYQKFINAIRGANSNTRKGRYGPAPAMRIEGPTP